MSFHSDAVSWFRANWYLLFILNAACLAEKEIKYQFYSLWFDLSEARTHNQPHSRLARKPLNHRWGFESAMPLKKLIHYTLANIFVLFWIVRLAYWRISVFLFLVIRLTFILRLDESPEAYRNKCNNVHAHW